METIINLQQFLSTKTNRDLFYPHIYSYCANDGENASIIINTYPQEELDDDTLVYLETIMYLNICI